MDIKSPEERSKNMAAIHSKNTKPEIYLRKLLFARGYRYGVNSKSVPGHPDIYMKKYNTAIFVHGCFWHRHEGCKYAYMPKSRIEFWQKKFDANIKRDECVRKELMRKKVKVVIVWECTIKKMKKDEEFREDKLHQLEEYLQNAAFLRLMDKSEVNKAVDIALERCSIAHFRNRLIKNLSGGYQQRVGIAQAIVHNPSFVVLDEPTNGLDPNQIVDIRNLIREIAEEHSVLLSTHILSEVQAICNDIKMIDNGHLVFSGSMEDFDNYIAPDSFIIELNNSPGKEVLVRLAPNKGVEALSENRFRIFFNEDNTVTEKYVEASVMNDWNLKELVVERCSLDQIFAQLSGKVK